MVCPWIFHEYWSYRLIFKPWRRELCIFHFRHWWICPPSASNIAIGPDIASSQETWLHNTSKICIPRKWQRAPHEISHPWLFLLCWCIHFFAAFEFSDWVDPCVTLYITSLHLIRQTVSHTEHVLQRNLERSKHEFRTRWSWWSCGRKPSCLEKCSDGLVPRKRIAPQIWRIARGNARVVKGRMLLQPIPSICLLICNIYEIYYIGTPSGNVPETQ